MLLLTLLASICAAADDSTANNQVPLLEKIAIAGISHVLSNVLGTPCSLERVQLDLKQQVLAISGLKIGNPKGFNTPAAITVKTVRVEADPKLLFSKEPQIRLVQVDDAIVNAEASLKGLNLKTLLDNANKMKVPKMLQGDPNTRFRIEKAILGSGAFSFVSPIPGSKSSDKKLDRIEMSLMGNNNQGVTAAEAMSIIMQTLMDKTGMLKGDGDGNGLAAPVNKLLQAI